MKQLFFLMLLLTGLKSFAFPPPVINTPSNAIICDGGVFDLTGKNPEILGSLNPGLYTITYHLSATDSANDINPITNPSVFTTGVTIPIYVRVESTAISSDFALTNFLLTHQTLTTGTVATPSGDQCGDAQITLQTTNAVGQVTYILGDSSGPQSTVIGNPNITLTYSQTVGLYLELHLLGIETASGNNLCNQILNGNIYVDIQPIRDLMPPINLIIQQPVSSGETATFNLTDNAPIIINGQPDLTVRYFTNSDDANAGTSEIANPTAYTAVYGTQIWARIERGTNCFTTKSFFLYVRHPETNYIFIPDTVLKANLLSASPANQIAQNLAHAYVAIDTNGDNEIQYTEAANISVLNIFLNNQNSVADASGIEAFVNLESLDGSYQSFTRLDTSTMTNLKHLVLSHTPVTELDLSNQSQLQTFTADRCQLRSLDFSHSPLLTSINCADNFSHGVDTGLNTVNVTGLTLLTDLNLYNCPVTSLNTADLQSMVNLNVRHTGLTDLDITTMPNLQTLTCEEDSGLTSLDTTECPNLASLNCSGTQLTSLDVSENPALTSLTLSGVPLTSLDLSRNPNLCGLLIESSITFLNLKNGNNTCNTNFIIWLGPNAFVCCDDDEVSYFTNYFEEQFSGFNVNINSYCSFTPGGDYNTITGTVTFDANNNGCDANDIFQPDIRINVVDNLANNGANFTNTNGNYSFFTQAGSFTITPSFENPSWFAVSPISAVIPFANNSNNTVTQNFCTTANGIHPDVEVVIAPVRNARPGFDATYQVVYKNKGNQTLSGNITFAYDDAVFDFVSSTEATSLQSTGLLTFDYTNLLPFESRMFNITLNLNGPMETPAVNIDDQLNFTATVNPIPADENPADNQFEFRQTVTGSFDPNDINCLEGDVVSPSQIGNYLHYLINFENTGTAEAENIVVREEIDPNQFNINSLQVVNSSAGVTARLRVNVAEYIFQNINLHSGGHGNILLKVRTNSTLTEGTSVSKRVNIYFDYNFPVKTIPANTVFQSLSNPDVPVDITISVYPNPTKGNLNINCKNTINSVSLYDVQGRLLQINLVNENQATMDISEKSKGIYFMKIISDNGMKVEKIIRE